MRTAFFIEIIVITVIITSSPMPSSTQGSQFRAGARVWYEGSTVYLDVSVAMWLVLSVMYSVSILNVVMLLLVCRLAVRSSLIVMSG